MERRTIVPPSMRNVVEEKGYAPGLRVGPFVFVAGQVGRTPAMEVIADPEAQFVACFENLRAVLSEAGCTFDDIVDLTTYHVDMAAHWAAFRAVKNRLLPRGIFPWTAIGVAALADPALLLEVKATAVAAGA